VEESQQRRYKQPLPSHAQPQLLPLPLVMVYTCGCYTFLKHILVMSGRDVKILLINTPALHERQLPMHFPRWPGVSISVELEHTSKPQWLQRKPGRGFSTAAYFCFATNKNAHRIT